MTYHSIPFHFIALHSNAFRLHTLIEIHNICELSVPLASSSLQLHRLRVDNAN